MTDPGDTLPRMTADQNEPRPGAPRCCDDHDEDAEDIQCCEDCPHETEPYAVLTLDMSYIFQRRLEALAAAGEPLPAGITVESLAQWRAEHPDYDPDKPLGGQPLPDGVTVVEDSGEGDFTVGPAPGLSLNLPEFVEAVEVHGEPGPPKPEPFPLMGHSCGRHDGPHEPGCFTFPLDEDHLTNLGRVLSGGVLETTGVQIVRGEWPVEFPGEGPASGRHPDGDPYQPYTADDLQAQADDAEPVEPDARCLARTAAPTDEARRCPVHPSGAHECYEGPGHQGAKRAGRVGGFVPEVRPDSQGQAPAWAAHVCDCSFSWADLVQTPRRPTTQSPATRDPGPDMDAWLAGQFKQREIGS